MATVQFVAAVTVARQPLNPDCVRKPATIMAAPSPGFTLAIAFVVAAAAGFFDAGLAMAQQPRQFNTTCWPGKLGGGDIFRANMTVEESAAWCKTNSKCQGFTASTPKAPYPATCAADTVLDVHFKDIWGCNRQSNNKLWSIWQMVRSGVHAP